MIRTNGKEQGTLKLTKDTETSCPHSPAKFSNSPIYQGVINSPAKLGAVQRVSPRHTTPGLTSLTISSATARPYCSMKPRQSSCRVFGSNRHVRSTYSSTRSCIIKIQVNILRFEELHNILRKKLTCRRAART